MHVGQACCFCLQEKLRKIKEREVEQSSVPVAGVTSPVVSPLVQSDQVKELVQQERSQFRIPPSVTASTSVCLL